MRHSHGIKLVENLQLLVYRQLVGVFLGSQEKVLLGKVAVFVVVAVVVALLQHIAVEQSLDGPEAVAQGELVQRIVFKAVHKGVNALVIGAEYSIGVKFRHLLQLAVFRIGIFFCGAKPSAQGQAQPKSHHQSSANGADLVIHSLALL